MLISESSLHGALADKLGALPQKAEVACLASSNAARMQSYVALTSASCSLRGSLARSAWHRTLEVDRGKAQRSAPHRQLH